MATDILRIATCQFAVGHSIKRNPQGVYWFIHKPSMEWIAYFIMSFPRRRESRISI